MNKYKQKVLREAMKFDFLRSLLIGVYNARTKNPIIKPNIKSIFSSLNIDQAVTELNKDALSKTFKINEIALNQLIEKCKKEFVFPHLKFDGTTIKDSPGQLMNFKSPEAFQKNCIWFKYKDIEKWNEIKSIMYDPKLLEVATRYLGNNPIVRNQYLWWSFPALSNENKNFDSPRYWFHYDIDDYKFLKIFIYLNDVDSETGPHIVVKNTHNKKTWKYKKNRRIKSSKLEGFFDDKEVVELTGEKGTCFFEDTFTYHNGTPPQKPRLVLQVEYSLTNLKLG